MKRIALSIVTLLLAATSSLGQGAEPKLAVEYDKFKDITIVTAHLDLAKPATKDEPIPNMAWAEATAYYHGRKPVRPAKIFFYVYGHRLTGPLTDRELIFLVDGERIRAKFIGYQSPAASFSYTSFQRIAYGKSVECQAGYAEFTLTKNHLERLRQLIEHFKP